MSDDKGRRAVEALPSLIRVGGYDIRIEKWSTHQASSAQRWGEFSSIEQAIRIQIDMPSQFKAVDTFFHEVFHAIYWAYHVDDEDKEERLASTFGGAQMALYRDNPWIAAWVADVLA